MSVFQFPLIWFNWIVVKWLLLLFTVYFLQQLSWRSCVWLGANNPIDIMCRQNRRYLWTCKYLISCARKYLWKLRQRQWNAFVEIGHAAQAWGGDGERSFFLPHMSSFCPIYAQFFFHKPSFCPTCPLSVILHDQLVNWTSSLLSGLLNALGLPLPI